MSITTSASNGIIVTSAAKDSNASATALASQTAAAVNEVIVPNAITANNEGNLMASPVYPGRLIMLRHGATHVDTVTINAGGTGYAVDDEISDNGSGRTAARDAVFIVTAVSGGVITGIKLHEAGDTGTPAVTVGADRGEYSVEGTLTNRATTTDTGVGSGATLDLTFKDAEEVRFVTADASNTLTVHEDWIDGPANTMNWRVSYIIQDVATLTGMSLISKRTDDYAASRRIRVGDGTASTFGWLFFGEGVSLETSGEGDLAPSIGDADFNVQTDSRFDIGYIASGVPVSGASLFFPAGSGTEDNDIVFMVEGDADACNLYNSIFKAVNNYGADIQGPVDVKNANWFGVYASLNLTPSTSLDPTQIYEDLIIEGRVAVSGLDHIELGVLPFMNIDGITIANIPTGFRQASVVDSPAESEIRNGIFLPNNDVFIGVRDDADTVFKVVNPIWIIDRNNEGELEFFGTVNGEVQELFELNLTVTQSDGTAISGATAKIIRESS